MRHIWLLALAGCLPQQQKGLQPGHPPPEPPPTIPTGHTSNLGGPREQVINPTNLVITVDSMTGGSVEGETGDSEAVTVYLKTDYAAKWLARSVIKGGKYVNSSNIMFERMPAHEGVIDVDSSDQNLHGVTMGFVFDVPHEKYQVRNAPAMMTLYARDIGYCLDVFNTATTLGVDAVEAVNGIKPSIPNGAEECRLPPGENGLFNFDQRKDMHITVEHVQNLARRAAEREQQQRIGVVKCAALNNLRKLVSSYHNWDGRTKEQRKNGSFTWRSALTNLALIGATTWASIKIAQDHGINCSGGGPN